MEDIRKRIGTRIAELSAVRILDPACGTGNFLYVALRQLMDLQKQVIAFAARRELPTIELTVSPEQLYGIEINPYAYELAQITAWIGYLQWRNENGFSEMAEPILRPLLNIRCMDSILDYDSDGNPIEPNWPVADVIIGNPPFLGGNRIRKELGDQTVDSLFKLYDGRVPAFADLVFYWFEKARSQIELGEGKRVGLIATNSIRGGVNRDVLKRIRDTGDIFMAWSDRSWILEGAAVRVSIIGFDNGKQERKLLDGKLSKFINSDLTESADLTSAKVLKENACIAFKGPSPSGKFDISNDLAQKMLPMKNESGRPNSDVVRPVLNASDITSRSRNYWTIDFGPKLPHKEAMHYEAPYEHVREIVYPFRKYNRRKAYRERWWLYQEARVGLRKALYNLKTRYIVTPRVAKHRLFIWVAIDVMANDACISIAREDDYFFGVLHSQFHEIWALRLGTWLGKGNDPLYTPTTTFETFPFPWSPGQEPNGSEDERVAEIAHWARELVRWRETWLNPPREEMYAGVGDAYDKMLKKRTLTNLYNGLVYFRQTVKSGEPFVQPEFNKVTRKSVSSEEIQELDDIHTALDHAVLDAYGWSHDLSDEEILEHLLALNLARAKKQLRA